MKIMSKSDEELRALVNKKYKHRHPHDAGRKVLQFFERISKQPPPQEFSVPDFNQLNRDAVKSLHFLPEVVKTDEGFEVR